MENTKDEIIAKLYALRAGLSAISLSSDVVKQCESDSISRNKELSAQLEKVKDYEKQKEYAQRNAESCNLSESERKAIFNKYKNEEKKKTFISPIVLSLCVFFITTWLAIALTLCLFKITDILIAVLISVGVGAIVGVVCYFIKNSSINKKVKAMAEKEIREIIGRNKYCNENYIVLTNAYNEAVKQYNEMQRQLVRAEAESSKTVDEKKKQTKVLSDALTNQYSELLNPADWQNIDLIIFYLQTGRADTLKECLQLVDRQRQADAIVNEIRQATNNITSTIINCTTVLGKAMVECMNSLSSQIDLQGRQLQATLGNIVSQNEKLISSANLQNALQAKANVTSDQLKSDLEYMQRRMGMRA